PEGVPFVGGTYFPPADRQGMPGFPRVLRTVADAYRDRRGDVDATTARVRDLYAHATDAARATGALSDATLDRAWVGIAERYDAEHGGFEGRRSSRRPWVSTSGSAAGAAAATGTRSRSRTARSSRWRTAGSTTNSAAVSTGTPWMRSGSCRTSRRCSTTTRS